MAYPFFTRENILILVKELLWWSITAMVTYAMLYPVISRIYYLYTPIHAAFIFITLTYFRWSVTFRSLFFLRPSWIRFLLFTGNLVLFVYLMQYEQTLIGKLDNYFMEDFGFPKVIMYDDIKKEIFKHLSIGILLFGTGSLVMISAFQMRLIISYWQYYKHAATRMMED